MSIAGGWCALIGAVILWRPVALCATDAVRFSTSQQRWLLFFVCWSATVVPLLLVSVMGHVVPLRWEIGLLLTWIFAYEDARGAQLLFAEYASPALEAMRSGPSRPVARRLFEASALDETIDAMRANEPAASGSSPARAAEADTPPTTPVVRRR